MSDRIGCQTWGAWSVADNPGSRVGPTVKGAHCGFGLLDYRLLEHGVVVTYVTIRCRCDKFGAGLAQCARAARRKPGSIWHPDGVFLTPHGEPSMSMAPDSTGWCKGGAGKGRRKAFLTPGAAVKPGAAQDCHRPAAKLPGGEGRYSQLAHAKHVFAKLAACMKNPAENITSPPEGVSARCVSFATGPGNWRLSRALVDSSIPCAVSTSDERRSTWAKWKRRRTAWRQWTSAQSGVHVFNQENDAS
ncbi:hypothetical protein B0G81_7685 [Paraburkholderia sp. BL6665CI2N2]|nr:hypothetical protein B0G81_7685 [Paraburkholderia sp. BL6665CI2N2]